MIDPQTSTYTIALTGTAGTTYQVQVKAYNEAGSVLSGIGAFLLADVPVAPSPPTNDATVTNDSRIKVVFANPLPSARGSPIFGVQLAMDDGQGGDFKIVVGSDEKAPSLATSYTATDVVKGRTYRFKARALN